MFARGLSLVPSLVVHAEVEIAEQGEEDRIRWKGLLVVCLQQRVRGDLGRTDPIGRLGKRVIPLAERSGHKDPFTSLFSFGIQFFAFFGPFDGARRQLFDQSHLAIFMDLLHGPDCQKRGTN